MAVLLANRIFAGKLGETIAPKAEDVASFNDYIQRFSAFFIFLCSFAYELHGKLLAYHMNRECRFQHNVT